MEDEMYGGAVTGQAQKATKTPTSMGAIYSRNGNI